MLSRFRSSHTLWGLSLTRDEGCLRFTPRPPAGSFPRLRSRDRRCCASRPSWLSCTSGRTTADLAGWTEPPDLRVTVVRRTRGFGTPASFPISGFRGGLPRRGRSLPDGSLAEQAVRYGRTQYAHDGGYAVIARLVVWKGKLAKVVVVAVPDRDSAVLGPQLLASDFAARRRRPVHAVAAVGPW